MKESPAQDSNDISQSLLQVRELNTDNLINVLGIQKSSRGIEFNFFNRSILFCHKDFIDLSGEEILPTLKKVFCQYLLKSPKNEIKCSGKLVSFREFSGAGPLFSRFAENTNKTIEQTYSNKLEALKEKCISLWGEPVKTSSYDLSIRFKALPKIPVILQFNDADEILPADAMFLFHEDAEKYLDLRSLASIGTYITGKLIS